MKVDDIVVSWVIPTFNLFGLNSPPLETKSKTKIHHNTPSACGGEIHFRFPAASFRRRLEDRPD